MADAGGLQPPYPLAALICQNVKDNPDGTLGVFGICGKVTRKEVKRPVIPLGPQENSLFLFIAVAFEANKEHSLGIRFILPDGAVAADIPEYGRVKGRIGTVAINISTMPITKGGKYWFEIIADHEAITRVPLRVKIVWND